MESICLFQDRYYGKLDSHLFVFEPLWDSFRPIEKVGWNGSKFEIIDDKFKIDLFSKTYGYGSLEMKALCRRLSEIVELSYANEITDPIVFWKWCNESNVKWWKDRPCVFAYPCSTRDTDSWKRYVSYIQSRPKTLRNIQRMKMTKRLLPK